MPDAMKNHVERLEHVFKCEQCGIIFRGKKGRKFHDPACYQRWRQEHPPQKKWKSPPMPEQVRTAAEDARAAVFDLDEQVRDIHTAIKRVSDTPWPEDDQ